MFTGKNKMLVLVSLNFEMSWHCTFPTKLSGCLCLLMKGYHPIHWSRPTVHDPWVLLQNHINLCLPCCGSLQRWLFCLVPQHWLFKPESQPIAAIMRNEVSLWTSTPSNSGEHIEFAFPWYVKTSSNGVYGGDGDSSEY